MSDDERERLRARAEASLADGTEGEHLVEDSDGYWHAAVVVNAEDVVRLLDEIEAIEGERNRLRGIVDSINVDARTPIVGPLRAEILNVQNFGGET